MDEIENENYQEEKQINEPKEVSLETENQTATQSQRGKKRKSKKEKKNDETIEPIEPIITQSPDIPLIKENSVQSLNFASKEVTSENLSIESEEVEETKRGLQKNATPKKEATTKSMDKTHDDGNLNIKITKRKNLKINKKNLKKLKKLNLFTIFKQPTVQFPQ